MLVAPRVTNAKCITTLRAKIGAKIATHARGAKSAYFHIIVWTDILWLRPQRRKKKPRREIRLHQLLHHQKSLEPRPRRNRRRRVMLLLSKLHMRARLGATLRKQLESCNGWPPNRLPLRKSPMNDYPAKCRIPALSRLTLGHKRAR